MLEDKLRETDWELTQDTIEEQVARESYLQWLKDQEKYGKMSKTSVSWQTKHLFTLWLCHVVLVKDLKWTRARQTLKVMMFKFCLFM